MKNISTLLFFITLFSFGQNPDGKNASLHISPTWLLGTSTFTRSTTIWYPQSQVGPEQSVLSSDAGTIHNPVAFGFNTMIKIPTASFLTVSIAYSYSQRFEEFYKSDTETKYFSQYWNMNGSLHSMNVTLSVYNLFSVYQGD